MYLYPEKLPISAIIVGMNEAKLLEKSLPNLSFCDEILYFDLGSKDESIQIALNNKANVIKHEKVDGCEWIHSKYAKTTKNKWVLVIDPDEIIDNVTINNLYHLFNKNILTDEIGCVSVPIFYYFKQKKLLGTIWGGEKRRLLLAQNDKFLFTPVVHLGRALIDGYVSHDIPFNGNNGIQHYWSNSYRSLYKKHIRYLNYEAKSRYKDGQLTSISKIIMTPIKAFRISYLICKGYRDGFRGFLLSLFWAWYETIANINLYFYQRESDL